MQMASACVLRQLLIHVVRLYLLCVCNLMLCCCCMLQAALVTLELKHEQQQAAVWQQLLQSLPQPGLTTAYMAQRELQLGAQQ